jgi:hypothetical protein
MAVCGGGGDHGQKTVFGAYLTQYNYIFDNSAEKKRKKKFERGRRSPVSRTAGSASDYTQNNLTVLRYSQLTYRLVICILFL